MTRRLSLLLPLLALGCGKRLAPPGATQAAQSAAVSPASTSAATPPVHPAKDASSPGPEPRSAPGAIEDNLPFEPDGTRLSSVAWRTWVYTDTGRQRTRYGYLRVGAMVAARGPAVVNDGCAGGWYRVNPRGFVCVGLGASRDLDDPVAVASSTRPLRGQGAPYLYALSNESPPLLYFKLPSQLQMNESEGFDVSARGANAVHRLRATEPQLLANFGNIGDPPAFLTAGQKLEKPYGVKSPLRYAVHAGLARPDSGFAIANTFVWQGRAFGLTTELDLIALDRVKLVEPSSFRGVEILDDETLPVAFVKDRMVPKYRKDDEGRPVPSGTFGFREGVKVASEKRLPGGLLELRDGSLAPEASLRFVRSRASFPSFAVGDRKWLDISIQRQTLVAYRGRRAVYATLVSTGRGGMGDPEKVAATVRGTFMIYQKDVSSTMDGDEDRSDSFNLRDVPFVQYFHKGYALHGTYWHDDFGKVRSHGCVNLSPTDAAWLFEWTDPSVPPDWHGVVNKDRGTVVHIHA